MNLTLKYDKALAAADESQMGWNHMAPFGEGYVRYLSTEGSQNVATLTIDPQARSSAAAVTEPASPGGWDGMSEALRDEIEGSFWTAIGTLLEFSPSSETASVQES